MHTLTGLTQRELPSLLQRFCACITLLFCAAISCAAQELQVNDSQLQGKTIRSISIVITDIFEQPDNLIYREANALKVNTRQEVIRRELLFKEGQGYDHFLIEETLRVLRLQRIIRDVNIVPSLQGEFVDIKVKVQDTWTFLPQISYSSGTGRSRFAAGVSEGNIVGLNKRAEFLYEDDDGRKALEGVYDDPRVWGSDYRFVSGLFHRSDGDRTVLYLGDPARSLLDNEAWEFNADILDTVARLFENGDERYIFRQKKSDLGFRYTRSAGNPETRLRRYSLGWEYDEARFYRPTLEDFDDVNVDPDSVSQDPAMLAANRRYTGPVFTFQSVEQDFISKNYVDRFERVEDYNLGPVFSANLLLAPDFLGSIDDALLFSLNRSEGLRIGESQFLRGELGLASRRTTDDFEDTLFRGELKYYNVLGHKYLGGLSIGRHTLASALFLDYGNEIDRDREFLIGGDNALRGYESRSFTGDKRYALNLEDRIHIADDVFSLVSCGAAFFAEMGGATYSDLGNLLGRDTYGDIGVGLRFAFPRSSGERVLRIDLALPLRDADDGSGALEPRIIFAGGQLFDSRLRSEQLGPEKASVEIGFDR